MVQKSKDEDAGAGADGDADAEYSGLEEGRHDDAAAASAAGRTSLASNQGICPTPLVVG